MIIYPAIDIMDGKCVRLTYGEKERRTDYSDDPAAVARRWYDAGARRLHVIDLDAAIDQKPLANFETIKKIVDSVSPLGMMVQVGGGVRDSGHINSYLDIGVGRVIVGTKVIESESFAAEIFSAFGARVVLALDSRDGRVAVKGWTELSDVPTEDFARKMDALGARTMNVTDITRDGALTEPNFDMMDRLCRLCKADIIASGGVSSIEHVKRLAALNHSNMHGAIVGKALYEGKFDLAQAVRLFQE